MTDFNFAKPAERYDATLAHEGTEIPVVDEMGNYRGTWLMTLRDDTDQRYRAAATRYSKVNANRLRALTPTMKAMDQLVELNVKGWKDIKAADGKEVAFSKEAAKAYLSQEWAYFDLDYLFSASANVALFNNGEDTKEDEAGN